MNFKKVFMSMMNFVVLAAGLIVYTTTCKADINSDMYTHLKDTLLIGGQAGDQLASVFTVAYCTNQIPDINFTTNFSTFWTNWNDKIAGSYNTPSTWSAAKAGIQSTLQAEIKSINEVGGIGDYIASWMGKEAIRAVGQAAYYATTVDHLLKIQPILTALKSALRNPGSTPLFFESFACPSMYALNNIQTALYTKDQNFLNAKATEWNTSLANATTYAAVKSIIDSALAYTSAYSTTSFATLGTTLLAAFNKAVALAQPNNYTEITNLITNTAAISKYGQTFEAPLQTITNKNSLGSNINNLNAATTNKNFNSIVTNLNLVAGVSPTDATLRTNLNTALVSALTTAAGLATNSTQIKQVSDILTMAKNNSAVIQSTLAPIKTEVAYITDFYNTAIKFDALNKTLTTALSTATPVTMNFANKVYAALAKLIDLIPSAVKSPALTRAALTAQKTAVTTRANALKTAKATLAKARTTTFMSSLKIQINSELISKKLPKK